MGERLRQADIDSLPGFEPIEILHGVFCHTMIGQSFLVSYDGGGTIGPCESASLPDGVVLQLYQQDGEQLPAPLGTYMHVHVSEELDFGNVGNFSYLLWCRYGVSVRTVSSAIEMAQPFVQDKQYGYLFQVQI